MSAMPRKHGPDEYKKSASKKNVLENIEKERFLSSAGSSRDGNLMEIPEIDEIQSLDEISEPPAKPAYKELDVEILKKNSINVDDKTDLTILIEALEPESEIEEPDEVWQWNQLFTNVSAQISEEK